jgi:hypothetical protein
VRNARVKLDSWRFWIGVAYFGLVLLFVCILVLFSKQSDANARERTKLATANSASVGACVSAWRSAPNVLRILDLLDVLAYNSIKANRAAIEQDPMSPLTPIRRASLKRLAPAPQTIEVFRRGTKKDQKTLAECKMLAAKLHVNIKAFLTQKEAGKK